MSCDILKDVDGSDHAPVYCNFEFLTEGGSSTHSQGENVVSNDATAIPSSRFLFEKMQKSMKQFLVDTSILKQREDNGFDDTMDRKNAKKTESTTKAEKGISKDCKIKPKQASLKSFFKKPSNALTENKREIDTRQVYTQNAVMFQEIPELVEINKPSPEDNEKQRQHGDALKAWQQLQHRMASSIPLCKGHRETCKIRQVKKKDSPNFGRTFFCCPRPAGAKQDTASDCGFFMWANNNKK